MQKVAIITGTSRGIGLACALRLVGDGWKVYGISRSECKREEFSSFQADVNDNEKIAQIFEEIFQKEGRIDALVNNAGFGIAGAIEDTKGENVDAIVNTNLSSVVKLCTLAIKYLKKSKGRIVNISSVAGIVPLPYQACYSATKAGVEIFSRALAMELAPYKVKVTAVLPGDTKTDFTSARVVDGQENARATKSIGKMAKDEQNGRNPDVVAKVVGKVLKQKNPPLRKSVGFMSKFEIFLTRICSTKFVNFIVKKLYG